MHGPDVWHIVLGAGLLLALAFALMSRRAQTHTLREMERLAFHDALTSLPNRKLFLDRASFAFAHARRDGTAVAVVFLDLDRFKLVNDSYGHKVGDDVLRAVGRRLREHLREVDTVARIGGDEFTLLLPGIRGDGDLEIISSKLLDVFRAPIAIDERELVVTASLGISLYPADAADPQALITRADAAMYRVKQRGGDDVQLYDAAIEVAGADELELEQRLRRALARQEFVLHYQPRLELASGRVIAFEALLRWNDPHRGLVAPGEFIHAAEISGLIVPIGEWVLRTACRQIRQWHEDGGDGLYVSVNLSARQFQHPELASMLERVLADEKVAAHFLELEVDENIVMQHADASMLIFARLKSTGVRVLVSHFGAGYSSLSYLRRFPIDGLKLDRSFLSGSERDRALASAALSMAKALDLKVIGEGVETEEAAQFLKVQECDGMQGYLVSAPVPPQDCAPFVGSARNALRA